MNRIERLGLDGHALRLFLLMLETGSVTATAERLEMTQSAVSHALRRLAQRVDGPLFVKSGRALVPTAFALALQRPAEQLLAALQAFGSEEAFVPGQAEMALTIAANDLQRDLLLPAFLARLEGALRHVSLRVVPSLTPSAEILREGRCDLLVTPFPPAGLDILQRRLFSDRYVCFYDAAAREAPRTAQDYLSARHVTVMYPDGVRLDFDRQLQAAGIGRDIVLHVSSFSGVPAFLRGTARLATMPSLFAAELMRGFAQTDLPLEALRMRKAGALVMMMAWHRRSDADPRQGWVRAQLLAAAQDSRRPGGRRSGPETIAPGN